MIPWVSVTTDTTALVAALDTFADVLHPRLKANAKVTADRIVAEAQGRVARRTGETASHIVAEETHSGDGYIVWVEPDVLVSWHTMPSGRGHTQKVSYNALGGWLEFGTDVMSAKPFLFASARLEEGAHDRRARQIVLDVIAEQGLGD